MSRQQPLTNYVICSNEAYTELPPTDRRLAITPGDKEQETVLKIGVDDDDDLSIDVSGVIVAAQKQQAAIARANLEYLQEVNALCQEQFGQPLPSGFFKSVPIAVGQVGQVTNNPPAAENKEPSDQEKEKEEEKRIDAIIDKHCPTYGNGTYVNRDGHLLSLMERRAQQWFMDVFQEVIGGAIFSKEKFSNVQDIRTRIKQAIMKICK